MEEGGGAVAVSRATEGGATIATDGIPRTPANYMAGGPLGRLLPHSRGLELVPHLRGVGALCGHLPPPPGDGGEGTTVGGPCEVSIAAARATATSGVPSARERSPTVSSTTRRSSTVSSATGRSPAVSSATGRSLAVSNASVALAGVPSTALPLPALPLLATGLE
ncbi:UNVERIFIED_CONTAM: hypothetical protein FKN15_014860 [Acipenser sinensis]